MQAWKLHSLLRRCVILPSCKRSNPPHHHRYGIPDAVISSFSWRFDRLHHRHHRVLRRCFGELRSEWRFGAWCDLVRVFYLCQPNVVLLSHSRLTVQSQYRSPVRYRRLIRHCIPCHHYQTVPHHRTRFNDGSHVLLQRLRRPHPRPALCANGRDASFDKVADRAGTAR